MGVHEDRGDLTKGKKRTVTRLKSLIVSPTKQDAVDLNKNKNGLRKIFRQNQQGKVEK
jgi:hypothetical protein